MKMSYRICSRSGDWGAHLEGLRVGDWVICPRRLKFEYIIVWDLSTIPYLFDQMVWVYSCKTSCKTLCNTASCIMLHATKSQHSCKCYYNIKHASDLTLLWHLYKWINSSSLVQMLPLFTYSLQYDINNISNKKIFTNCPKNIV